MFMSSPVQESPYYRHLVKYLPSEDVKASRKGIKKLVAFTPDKVCVVFKRWGIVGLTIHCYSIADIKEITLRGGAFTSALELEIAPNPPSNQPQLTEIVHFSTNQMREWDVFVQKLRGQQFAVKARRNPPPQRPADPLEILNERFARGEITEQEYQRKRELLR